MRNAITIILFSISHLIFSQNKFLDMRVTYDNDTIYGAFRSNELFDLLDRRYRKSKKQYNVRTLNGKTYFLTLLKNKEFFSDDNDSIVGIGYYSRSPILNEISLKKEHYYYVRTLNKKERRDYIVTHKKDTIYGRIKQTFLGSKRLITDSNEKYSISRKTVISFRRKGDYFYYRKKLRVSESNYIKLLYDGSKAKLYLLEIIKQKSYQYYYYIERNGKLELIIPERFTRMIMRIMPENKELINKLKKREYKFHDIYLVVKYFNES